MDLQAVPTQVDSWPVEDRLLEQIWDGLLNQGHEPGLTEDQKAEVELRLAGDDAAQDDVVSREEIKSADLKRAEGVGWERK
jgi:putative addiction module component (TIGR02574 family)